MIDLEEIVIIEEIETEIVITEETDTEEETVIARVEIAVAEAAVMIKEENTAKEAHQDLVIADLCMNK